MASTRPVHVLLGLLLFTDTVYDVGALQPVSDAVGDETFALEKGEWPWLHVGRLFGKKNKETDHFEVHEGLPPSAGCYMRMPSECPKKPMRTQAWRRDTWASQHGLDEVGCHQRKHLWETYCGSEDAEMLYVSNRASSEPASSETSAEQVGNERSPEQVGKETNSEQVGNETGSELVSNERNSEPASRGTSSEQVRNETSSEPVSNETSSEPAGLLQLDDELNDALSWPWAWRHKGKSQEKAPSAQAQQPLAVPDSDVLDDLPSQPGCYMRMASECPRKPMKTHAWRHDAWAEQHGLDKAGCEARKRVWEKYCEADDAKMVFIPRQ